MPTEPLHANLELVPVSPIYHYIWQNVMDVVNVERNKRSNGFDVKGLMILLNLPTCLIH